MERNLGDRGKMIAILGSSGMLGSMVAEHIGMDFVAPQRPDFDARNPDMSLLEGVDRVINCIGLIKPHCGNVEDAIKVNALFPHYLPRKTIQIATDCVFSGTKGNYTETSPHDATDVYGKTKSLGEAPHLTNLRCSIIGPEIKNHLSLLDWFLAQEGEVSGFTNHFWNGITTYHFAKICKAIIEKDIDMTGVQHIVPANVVTKYELLRIIADVYGKDIEIAGVKAPEAIDRTLSTDYPLTNKEYWRLAGYDSPPTIRQMIEELAAL